MANTTVWLITALTNLHVGDECSTGYGIIDKSVQRNPITTLPCINSSSLKGALNEYFCKNTEFSPAKLVEIFGSDKKEKKIASQKGSVTFFDANLAAIPNPTNDTNLYQLVSSSKIREEFRTMCSALGINDVNLPDETLDSELRPALDIAEMCNDESLPIIARNCLENGVSKNLWYEQVVPQQTVFYTFITADDAFVNELENSVVQIGANATIGYGYCKFKRLG